MNLNIVKLRTIGLAATLAWTNAASAQSTEEEELALAYGDKTVVSIATGSSQPIARAPSAATVVTSNDIKAIGATDLNQVLESVPGLHVSVSAIGYDQRVAIRGILTERGPQVLWLLNGHRLNTTYLSNRGSGLGDFPVENIARIEIIRGPGSALYGADAFSGVINIITKTASDINGTEYGARIGSFKTRDAWLQYGGQLGTVETAIYLRAGKSDGQNNIIETDLQTILDKAFNTHISNAPGPLSLSSESFDASADFHYQDWRFRASYQERKTGLAIGLIDSLDPQARFPTSRLYVDAKYQKENIVKNWDFSAGIGYSDSHEDASNPPYRILPAGAFGNTFPDGLIAAPHHKEREIDINATAVYSGFNNHRIRIGTGYRDENLYAVGESKNFFTAVIPGVGAVTMPLSEGVVDVTGNPALVFLLPQKRSVSYFFAQDEWTLTKDWTLTAGVRKDRYSDFGNTTNPRLALVWDAAYNIVIKALHGRAFRAPSFVEEYAKNNPASTGNPALQPETITTNELAFAWQPKSNVQTNLTIFHYKERNIIRFVANADPTTGSTAKNAGDQTGRGLELESAWDPDRNLRLTGSYSLQHSTDESTGKDAGLAPHHRVFLRSDWRFAPSWQFGATLNYVANRQRQAGDARPQIADFTTIDLSLRREKLLGNWEVRAAVKNLFNRDIREPSLAPGNILNDLPLPRRSFYIQLQHNL
jgi:iron complex outermembrane receptor protein